MNDTELLEAWKNNFAAQHHEAVICTVVRTRGSAYRCPGAKMIVFADGGYAGIVSGGCLEADLRHRAMSLFASDKQSEVVWYDTSRDDDVLFGSGTGCGGETVFLVEKTNSLNGFISSSKASVTCRIFESSSNEVAALGSITNSEHGRQTGASDSLISLLSENAGQVWSNGKSEIRQLQLADVTISVFFEYLAPPIKLSVFGAGADALPLIALARQLGWNVSVFDWRPAFSKPERFAEGVSTHCVPFDDLHKLFSADASAAEAINGSAAVVMSHSLSNDLSAIRFLSSLREDNVSLTYLGALGPKKRTERLLNELRAESGEQSESAISKLTEQMYYPAGLDIGAEDSREIAIAIIAEITAVSRQRGAGFLKDRNAPIHDLMKESTGSEFSSPTKVESCNSGLEFPINKSVVGSKVSLATASALRVGAVILAAGKAERFGSAKQLLEFNGRSLIENAISSADAINCDPVMVITGAYHYELLEHISSLKNQNQLSRIEIKQNIDWKKGIGGSIALGTKLLKDRVDAIVFIACDQPYVDADLLKRMLASLSSTPALQVVASKYADTFGVPAIFRKGLFDQLSALPSSKGAKLVIQANLADSTLIEFPMGAVDIDTTADYETLLGRI